ncbi:IQ_calmodulin-binding motif family protein [Hexamita inflata]|uniref:IQ_calmodulin-binding motif family protein n=1 Tax=Hexamita inflata TaxID=28002 RepID=A0ABP1GKE0_9EUKA
MNKIKREAIGRLKNFQQKKAVYGQMDLFKRQFGILGLTGALRTEINEQLENGETENAEINNDEEIQVEIVGAFAMVVDQKRFDEDGTTFQLEIIGKNEEGVQYKLIGEKGKVWAERE